MIDFAKITVTAGKGGNGAGSFRRVKGKRRGKADGGDGGRGGNVWIETTLDLNTLEPFRFVKNYKGQDGQRGFSNLRRGANGRDLVLKVPAGTVVRVENAGPVTTFLPALRHSSEQASAVYLERSRKVESPSHSSLSLRAHPSESKTSRATRTISAYDLVAAGEKVMVAKGGEGGRGNAKLRDEFGRRPKAGEKGKTGEVCQITLELKLIADVGLIGLPNAGKSTLLAALTAARPQIASYPFTTLEPNLGVLTTDYRLPTTAVDSRQSTVDKPASLVLADIPGLIEGAAKGRGLGDLFLKHIERTKMLVHLIDVSTASDKWNDYQIIRGELKTYSKELVKKKEIIVLNKIDLVSKSEVSKIRKLFSQKRKRVFVVSAQKGEGLEELVREILKVTNVSNVSKGSKESDDSNN